MLIMSISMMSGLQVVNAQQNIGEQVQINWRTAPAYNGKDNLDLKIVIRNISDKPIDLKSWNLWFNSMFPVLEKKIDAYEVTDEDGNLFKLSFSGQVISVGDSLEIDYQTQFPIANISTTPNGFYFQEKSNVNNYSAINNIIYSPINLIVDDEREFYNSLYDKNDRLNKKVDYSLVFPTPKSVHVGKGFFTVKKDLTFYFDRAFDAQEFLSSEIKTIVGTSLKATPAAASQFSIKKNVALPDEAYTLKINKNGIEIFAASSKGVFYAIQSLKSMLFANNPIGLSPVMLPFVEIEDGPRYAYRGFMLDIARNFKSKDVILKYLDVMAAYKLNVFHFHLIDDEGWRIEISSLPELTDVGSKRSPSFAKGDAIFPAYGSGASDTARHYLTRADFIAILKYAKDRFITVVPEIETPGHARAAIKAMEARYHRLSALGKHKEAKEYLLHDFEDISTYNSAQNFKDNILNPALPSVYTFIDKILDEFKSMYDEAGVNFATVSLGGDEVPNGVWEKSPKIQALMKEKGFTSVNQIWPYYISRINEICASKGLNLAGWEEIGMVNQGKGMVVNTDLPNKKNIQLDVWNNVIGGGQEDLAYRLANAGYATVLISASNLYFDMMWNTSFAEPGLKWATYADLYHSYSLLPEAYFANIDTYYSGKALGKAGFRDRVRLTDTGKKNLIGIKGGLFAETVHDESKLDYMVFPRFFTLAERAWSPKQDYESEDSFSTAVFDKDYTRFINRIGKVDLPKLSEKFDFRLPAVGVRQIENTLFANIEYPGFDIYYTTDGTIPSSKSMKYNPKKGIANVAGKKYTFAVVDSKGRVGQLTHIN